MPVHFQATAIGACKQSFYSVRTNLQKYIGPKFAGKYGNIMCPYFNAVGSPNLNIYFAGSRALLRFLKTIITNRFVMCPWNS